jgi:hypothetical protein
MFLIQAVEYLDTIDNKKWAEYLKRKRDEAGKPLVSLLILPVQRLPRYEMLLEQVYLLLNYLLTFLPLSPFSFLLSCFLTVFSSCTLSHQRIMLTSRISIKPASLLRK